MVALSNRTEKSPVNAPDERVELATIITPYQLDLLADDI